MEHMNCSMKFKMLELNQYYNMDNTNGMQEFPDKFFELAIVDCPYGTGEDGSKNHTRTKLSTAKDYTPVQNNRVPGNEFFEELFRVSKNQIIWGANHFISKVPIDSSCWIVWDKVNGKNDFADCELAWTSFNSATRIFRYMWQGMNQGKSISEGHIMQGDKSKNEKRIHIHQKPIPLYIWTLQNYAKQGWNILDTNVGSASSLIACKMLNFDM